MSVPARSDVLVVGGGHNGLIASVLLAKRGLKVTLLEAKPKVGGASVTEYPFRKAPRLGVSTGAYLLGVMPPELMRELGLNLTLKRRDPHYFLPRTREGYLLFGSDERELERQFRTFFSDADWRANQAMNAELAQLRDDLAPAWLQPPLSLEETAECFIRPELRTAFVRLCRGSARVYLERWGFQSDLVKAMYAVTDGFSGVNGGYDTPGTGHNLLVHNMCRLPGSGGTWMIVEGGMGAVTQSLSRLAQGLGVTVRTGAPVKAIRVEGKVARGVVLESGEELTATSVVVNADPFRGLELLRDAKLPQDYVSRVREMQVDGTTMKVNLALTGLPRFTCLPEDRGQFGPTIHLLPEEDVLGELERGFRDVRAGRLAEFPSMEWYFHTPVDATLRDDEGHHNSALFVQWVPYELSGGKSWEQEESRYVQHLLSLCDRFAPGTSALVKDVFTLTPKKIESHFGISRGHIHHVDNTLSFTDRLPYATPVEGVWFCSAGCHPAGSVLGAAGHNAAQEVLRAMGKA